MTTDPQQSPIFPFPDIHHLQDVYAASAGVGPRPRPRAFENSLPSDFDFRIVVVDSRAGKKHPAHRIVVETTYDQCTRNFHVNDRLFTKTVGHFEPNADMVVDRLRKQLLNIKGVTAVDVDQYYVAVTIGLAFDWEDLQQQVIKTLATHLKWGDRPFDDFEVARR